MKALEAGDLEAAQTDCQRGDGCGVVAGEKDRAAKTRSKGQG
jgi:hypothetical protein